MVVSGALYHPIAMRDMVYQGAVLGPCLWIFCYSDVQRAVRGSGFLEEAYADDLNSYKVLAPETTDSEAFAAIDAFQHEVHLRGRANRVSFDPGKESKYICLSPGRW